MREATRHVGLSLVLTTALLTTFAVVVQASEPKGEAVGEDKVEEVVDGSQQEDQSATDTATDDGRTEEVGEASYNVEDCEALIEESEQDASSDAGAEKLDLDKCRQLIK